MKAILPGKPGLFLSEGRSGGGAALRLASLYSTPKSKICHLLLCLIRSTPACLLRHPPDAHPCLQQADLDLVAEVSPLLTTLQTLMKSFPAPSPEIAAARVGPAAILPESEPDTRSAPLDAMPISGLIVRAWCGLALWALSEHRHTITSSAGAGAGVSDGEGDAGRCSAPGGDRKGHGKQEVAAQGKTPPPTHERKGTNEGSPLTVVLRWLLRKEETPRGGGVQVAIVAKGVGIDASGGNVVGGGEKETPGTTASSANLAEWRPALLAALIRAMMRLSLSAGRGEDPNAGLHGPERIRERLEIPMVAVSPPPGSIGASPICSGCTRSDDVEGIILRGQDGGVGGGGGRGGNAGGCSGDTPEVSARAAPLWLALLAGVLRERCDCHRSDATHPSSAPCRGDRDVGGGDRPSFARQAHRPSRLVDHRPEGARGSRRICFPKSSLLAELLGIAPIEGAAQVLSSLSMAIAALSEPTPTPSTLPDAPGRKTSTGQMWNSLARKRSSALIALGRVWHAEAARSLSAWKLVGLSRPARVGSVDATLDSPQRARSGVKRPVASHSPVGNMDAQPSDRLLGDTTDTLQFLLKTASLVLHSPPSIWEPLPCTECSAVGVGRTASGHACGTDRCVVGRVGGVQGPEAEGRLHDDEARSRSCSQGSLDAVDATFGTEAADIWHKLFDARKGHRLGFSNLLRKISKDCAVLALSSPREASAGSAWGENGPGFGSRVPVALDSKFTGCTLEFSQTQRGRRGDGSGNAARNVNQDGLKGKRLAPPPPRASLPVLTAAALALLRSAPKEPDNKSRGPAWRAGLATLAWVLTASLPPRPTPLPASAASPPSARKKGGGHSTETPRTVAVMISDGVITAVRECLTVARRAVASGPREVRSPRAKFLLDEASMTAMSRLLAVGIGLSGGDSQRIASGSRARLTSPAQASCVAAHPAVSEEIWGVALSVVSAVKDFSPDELVSPGLLPALCPMLEAALEIPKPRYASSVGNPYLVGIICSRRLSSLLDRETLGYR